jgi:hypothetical protein
MYAQIILDKPPVRVFNVLTLNQEAKMMTLMEAGKKTEVGDLEAGWYVIGFENLDGTPDYGPIYHYHGEGYWTDEGGEEIESLWDPILQDRVAVDAADFYVKT